MEVGTFDPLPGFQTDVQQAMEDLGNDVGRPLVMKVSVEVKSGELARDKIGEFGDESPDAEDTETDRTGGEASE